LAMTGLVAAIAKIERHAILVKIAGRSPGTL
jgi:hypothetical protein